MHFLVRTGFKIYANAQGHRQCLMAEKMNTPTESEPEVNGLHHHHHHSRLTSTSSALARVGRFLPNQAPPLQSVLRPLCLKVQRAQVMSHTFTPRLLTPASALWSGHLEVSTSRHPILLTLTLEMSKPSQSTTPHNDCDFLHTQAPIQLHAWYSLLETHTTHPPDHHTFRSFHTLHILCCHRPGFTTI